MQHPQPQYLQAIKKGDTVTYGNNNYRVQDDGRGYLHIIIFKNGKRKKLPLQKIDVWFEYGTETDYIFNGWYKIYPTFEMFNQFATNEINAI